MSIMRIIRTLPWYDFISFELEDVDMSEVNCGIHVSRPLVLGDHFLSIVSSSESHEVLPGLFLIIR